MVASQELKLIPYDAIHSRWKSFADGQDTFNSMESFMVHAPR